MPNKRKKIDIENDSVPNVHCSLTIGIEEEALPKYTCII